MTKLKYSFLAYKCKFCDRAFAQSNDLVKHTRSHVGENTYQCNLCPKAFRLHSELRQHGKDHFLEQKRKMEEQEQNNDGDNLNDYDNGSGAYIQDQTMITSAENSS